MEEHNRRSARAETPRRERAVGHAARRRRPSQAVTTPSDPPGPGAYRGGTRWNQSAPLAWKSPYLRRASLETARTWRNVPSIRDATPAVGAWVLCPPPDAHVRGRRREIVPLVEGTECAYVRAAGHQPTWGRTAAHRRVPQAPPGIPGTAFFKGRPMHPLAAMNASVIPGLIMRRGHDPA